jgi:hypothetical protein
MTPDSLLVAEQEHTEQTQQRPQTLSERVTALYHTSRSAKPFGLAQCVDAIAGIVAGKIEQDRLQVHLGGARPLQPLHYYCRCFNALVLRQQSGSETRRMLILVTSGCVCVCVCACVCVRNAGTTSFGRLASTPQHARGAHAQLQCLLVRGVA